MFKPLLYQVASSQLNVGDIAFPFRKIFNSWKDFYFRMAYIESVDPTCKILRTTAGEVEYDYLILATGCVPNFFGIDAVKREALAMSNITDALNIRNRVLRNFELAVTAATPGRWPKCAGTSCRATIRASICLTCTSIWWKVRTAF